MVLVAGVIRPGRAALLLAAVAVSAGNELVPGKAKTLTIGFGGLLRTCTVRMPSTDSKEEREGKWPLVFVLHGGGGTSASVARLTGFSRIADSAGFIVAYPNAVNGHWNDGRGVRRFRSHRHGIDDVGFVRALIDKLVAECDADPSRVYATGISNGAMMCHRLGCELGERIAAIAPVAGGMPVLLAEACRPQVPVSVLAINGTQDRMVPYEGGGVGLGHKSDAPARNCAGRSTQLASGVRNPESDRSTAEESGALPAEQELHSGDVLGAEATALFWAEADSCVAHSETDVVADTDPEDGMRVVREWWQAGRDSSEVVLLTVEGGGHTWPGGAKRPGRFGATSRDMDATREIWSFFRRHSR
jgi:polyhydroxybutyrate depolymerase